MTIQIDMLKPTEVATLAMRGLYEDFGYKKYRMSRFEEYSLYAANQQFLSDDKVITFTDLDGRLLALKPDVTISIIKNTKATKNSREKVYYLESVFRENKESHTFHEISQMGLEVLGNVDSYAIIEVLQLAAKSLSLIGKNYLLVLSNMDFVLGLLESVGIGEESYSQILPLIEGKNNAELRRALWELNLKEEDISAICSLTSLYGDCQKTLEIADKMVQNDRMAQAVSILQEVYQALDCNDMADCLQLDFSMVNDVDYYNGIIFQGYLEELPRKVLAGGQYDGMVKKMGKDAAGIGYAIYLSDLERMPQTKASYDVEALVLYDTDVDTTELFQAVLSLRKNGMRVLTERVVPPEIRYEKLYRFQNGILQEVKKEC